MAAASYERENMVLRRGRTRGGLNWGCRTSESGTGKAARSALVLREARASALGGGRAGASRAQEHGSQPPPNLRPAILNHELISLASTPLPTASQLFPTFNEIEPRADIRALRQCLRCATADNCQPRSSCQSLRAHVGCYLSQSCATFFLTSLADSGRMISKARFTKAPN